MREHTDTVKTMNKSGEWDKVGEYVVPVKTVECDKCSKVICENHYFNHKCEVITITITITHEIRKGRNIIHTKEKQICSDCLNIGGGFGYE